MYNVVVVTDDKRNSAQIGKFLKYINPELEVTVTKNLNDFVDTLKTNQLVDVVVVEATPTLPFLDTLTAMNRENIFLPTILMFSEVDPELMGDAINNHVDNCVYIHGSDPAVYFSDLNDRIIFAIERRRVMEEREVEAKRYASLVELAKMSPGGSTSIVDYALNKAIELTSSKIGYVSTYSKKTNKLTMMAWSFSAMNDCRMKNYPMEFDLDTSGVWGVPVRTGQTLIINDYESSKNPHKHGVPIGHIQLKRLLMVPIFLNGEIVGTAGVGNKVREYTSQDEVQVQQMMQEMLTLEVVNSEKKKYDSRMNLLNEVFNNSPSGVTFISRDGKIAVCNKTSAEMLKIDVNSLPIELSSINSPLANRFKAMLENNVIDQKTDDTVIIGNRTWALVSYPYSKGSVDGHYIINTDITDLNSYKAVASRSQDYVKTLYRIVQDALDEINQGLPVFSKMINDPQMTYLVNKLDDVVHFMTKYSELWHSGNRWIDLAETISEGIKSLPENERSIAIILPPIQVFSVPTLGEIFASLRTMSAKYYAERSAASITFAITNGMLRIIYKDLGDDNPLVSENKTMERLRLMLSRKICENSGFIFSWPPTRSGILAEVEVPPDKYRIG